MSLYDDDDGGGGKCKIVGHNKNYDNEVEEYVRNAISLARYHRLFIQPEKRP